MKNLLDKTIEFSIDGATTAGITLLKGVFFALNSVAAPLSKLEYDLLTNNSKRFEKHLKKVWPTLSEEDRDLLLNKCENHFVRVFSEAKIPQLSRNQYIKDFGVWPTRNNRQNLLLEAERILKVVVNAHDQPIHKEALYGLLKISLLNELPRATMLACVEQMLDMMTTPSIKTLTEICEYLWLKGDAGNVSVEDLEYEPKRVQLLHRATQMCFNNPQWSRALFNQGVVPVFVKVSSVENCRILLKHCQKNPSRMEDFLWVEFPYRSAYTPQLLDEVLKACTQKDRENLRIRSLSGSPEFLEIFNQYDALEQRKRLQKAVDANTECTKDEQSLFVDKSLIVKPPVRKRKM